MPDVAQPCDVSPGAGGIQCTPDAEVGLLPTQETPAGSHCWMLAGRRIPTARARTHDYIQCRLLGCRWDGTACLRREEHGEHPQHLLMFVSLAWLNRPRRSFTATSSLQSSLTSATIRVSGSDRNQGQLMRLTVSAIACSTAATETQPSPRLELQMPAMSASLPCCELGPWSTRARARDHGCDTVPETSSPRPAPFAGGVRGRISRA